MLGSFFERHSSCQPNSLHQQSLRSTSTPRTMFTVRSNWCRIWAPPPPENNDRFFTIDINGKRKNFSVDRIKPAFVEDHQNDTEPSSSTTTITPPSPPKDHPEIRRTRSGWHVRWPARFVSYFDIGWRDSLLHFGSSSFSIHLHALHCADFSSWHVYIQCVPIKRKPVLSVRYLYCHARFNQTIYFFIKGIFSSFIWYQIHDDISMHEWKRTI